MSGDICQFVSLREPTLSVPTETVQKEMSRVTEQLFPGFVHLGDERAFEIARQNSHLDSEIARSTIGGRSVEEVEALDAGDPYKQVWNLARRMDEHITQILGTEQWEDMFEKILGVYEHVDVVSDGLAFLGLGDSGLQKVVRSCGHELAGKQSVFATRVKYIREGHGNGDTVEAVMGDARMWVGEMGAAHVSAMRQAVLNGVTLGVVDDYRSHFSYLWERHGQGKMVIARCWEPVVDVDQPMDGMGMRDVVVNVLMNAEKNCGLSFPEGLQVYTWMGIDEKDGFVMWVGNRGRAFPDEAYGGDAEYGQRAFNPNFTTEGTGYGLARVHEVITTAGGKVQVMPVESGELKMRSVLRFAIPLK